MNGLSGPVTSEEAPMTGGKLEDDGAISDLPWASVFDPANNMRVLGEIQARGFRAATELVDSVRSDE